MTDTIAIATDRAASVVFNGFYTITSPAREGKPAAHRTFKISTSKKGAFAGKRILSLLTGSDNTNDYTGFAFVTDQGIKVWNRFRSTSAFDGDGASAHEKMAKMVWSMLVFGEKSLYAVKGGCTIQKSTRCLVCNKLLTDPVSITTGIGPECRARGGMARYAAE